jgi:3-hydroxymyristoyl/3-hydroxydecanoyl-(acyl carrier protein) dehydratase
VSCDGAARLSVVGVELLEERASARSLVRTLRVADATAALEGHFPGFPIVPAVVQIHWVMEAAERLCGRALVVSRFDALKFRDVIRPGQTVRVTVDLSTTGDAAEFRIEGGDAPLASGRCVFAGGSATTP